MHDVATFAEFKSVLSIQMQILATGGMSFPKLGTDGTGHQIAEGLGHEMRPSYPALVPLRSSHPAGEQLAGEFLLSVWQC